MLVFASYKAALVVESSPLHSFATSREAEPSMDMNSPGDRCRVLERHSTNAILFAVSSVFRRVRDEAGARLLPDRSLCASRTTDIASCPQIERVPAARCLGHDNHHGAGHFENALHGRDSLSREAAWRVWMVWS